MRSRSLEPSPSLTDIPQTNNGRRGSREAPHPGCAPFRRLKRRLIRRLGRHSATPSRRDGASDPFSPNAGAGLGCSPSISRKIAWNNSFGTATCWSRGIWKRILRATILVPAHTRPSGRRWLQKLFSVDVRARSTCSQSAVERVIKATSVEATAVGSAKAFAGQRCQTHSNLPLRNGSRLLRSGSKPRESACIRGRRGNVRRSIACTIASSSLRICNKRSCTLVSPAAKASNLRSRALSSRFDIAVG